MLLSIAKNNILISEQRRLEDKLSTITQLINTTTDYPNSLNNKGQADIFLDFNKAFCILVLWLECRFLDTEVDGSNPGSIMLFP